MRRGIEEIVRDLRFGWRALSRSPGFTAVALLTLALGIGANTALFSFVNGVLLRTLPFREPDRLVRLFDTYPEIGLERASVSPFFFRIYTGQSRVFETLGAFTLYRAPANLTGQGDPEPVRTVMATSGVFTALGVPPLLGRVFQPAEEAPDRGNVVVLSHRLWQRRFGGDPSIADRTLSLDGSVYTVIGVMPAGFDYPSGSDLWIPLAPTPEESESKVEYLQVLGRLGPGADLAAARADMDSLSSTIRRQHPEMFEEGDRWHVTLVPLRDEIVGDLRPALLVLLAAVGFVLLIACANVANLLLARSMIRRREVAIRTALGASRSRMVRQLLTESVLLAVLGGGLGLLLAWWGLDLLLARLPLEIPSFMTIRIDGAVLGFTLGASVVTGLLFGLIPAFQATRTDLGEALKEGGRTATAGPGRSTARRFLVISEVALALILLVGAGLLIRSFDRLRNVPDGFDPSHLITARITLPETKYREPGQIAAFYETLLRRLQGSPGAASAGITSCLPLDRDWSMSFTIEGRDSIRPGPHADLSVASDGYARTLRIPLVRGRLFDARDGPGSLPVALIDERVVRRFWPDQDPVGRRIRLVGEGTDGSPLWREIVGVIGHVRHDAVVDNGEGEIVLPFSQSPARGMMLAVRTPADPDTIGGTIRAEVQGVDRDQSVADLRSMDDLRARAMTRPRFNTLLLGLFALVALLLAAVGIYGVMSYTVSQRTHEIGVRLALGARRGDILGLVVGQGMAVAIAGVAIGLVGAFLVTRALSGLLFGITPTDPSTFAGVALLLGGVALLAAYIPARRAARIDPIVALRHE